MSTATANDTQPIVRRANLDFGLEEDIPRHWFGGDAFKSRFFDAMSLLFPEGEKFFIDCVRDYKAEVTDPELIQEVKDFTFQEGQHSMVHIRYNNHLERQGINVPAIMEQQRRMIGWTRKKFPRKNTLAETAAAEHITAMMAEYILGHPEDMGEADPRIRAIYFWHAIEETEHKAVAFDVLQKVAGAGYFTRIFGLIAETILFPFFIFQIMRHMFRRDGFNRRERLKLWSKGLWWLYGPPHGLFVRMLPTYLSYYKPGFHPWQNKTSRAFDHWLTEYENHDHDPIAASNRFIGAIGK